MIVEAKNQVNFLLLSRTGSSLFVGVCESDGRPRFETESCRLGKTDASAGLVETRSLGAVSGRLLYYGLR
jgi:hypothetical protein